MDKFIPYNRPFIVGRELSYIQKAVQEGHLAGNGPFTKKCNDWMEKQFGARKILLTHSGTGALEMCALLCDIEPGDEVIMPSFTFVSTANAFVLRGARIRFVDIRSDTLNIDESLIESSINENTKLIVPVHYAGVGCAMDTIMEIAARFKLLVVEDAAQGVNATYKGRYLGTIGHLGAYSFHETKNFISGEGGALVINDERFMDRAPTIYDKGTDRSRFFRGEVGRYTWVDIGSSFLPSEMVAAFLYAQLEEAYRITEKRNQLFSYYFKAFGPLSDGGFVTLPVCPEKCVHNAHLFYLLVYTAPGDRDKLIASLKQKNIMAVFHYVPLHMSSMGLKSGYSEGDLPVTGKLSERLIRLPCYYELTREDQDRVIDAVFEFFGVAR